MGEDGHVTHSEPTTGTPTARAPTARGARGASRPRSRVGFVRDLAISLIVVVVPLVALVAFCQPRGENPPTVDPTETYRAAKREAGFPILTPTGLDGSWQATNAAYRTEQDGSKSLRVSYIPSRNDYIQLLQTDEPAEQLIPNEVGAADGQAPRPVATEQIGGRAWLRFAGRRDGEWAYVLEGNGYTVIVAGNAGRDHFRTFISSLR